MNKERELLVRIVEADMVEYMQLMGEAEELLAQPEQEVYAKGYAEAMQQLVYEAYESGRKSALSEQEPSDTEIITAYHMLVRRKLGLPEKNEVLQLGEPEFNARITVKEVCKHKNNGRCQLHNLQCQYPECEE